MMNNKVLVTGFFDRQNWGDDLFKWLYEKIAREPRFQKFDFHFVSTDDLNESELAGACAVVLGGGDTLNTYFVDRLETTLKDAKYEGPVYAFSCGIPYPQIVTEGKLDFFSYIVCRAKRDAQLLKNRYGSDRIRYHPDISILMETFIDSSHEAPHGTTSQISQPVRHLRKGIQKSSIAKTQQHHHQPTGSLNATGSEQHSYLQKMDPKSLSVVVTLARPIFKGNKHYMEVIKHLADLIDRIATHESDGDTFEVFLVPFNTRAKNSVECDLYINEDVHEQVKQKTKVHIVTDPALADPKNPQAMWELFTKEADFSLCMRYHAHMLSVVTQTPFLSLGISSKVKNLMQDLEMSRTEFFTVDSYDLPVRLDVDSAFKAFTALAKTKRNSAFVKMCEDYYRTYIDQACFEETMHTLLSSAMSGDHGNTTLKSVVREENVQDVLKRTADRLLDFLEKRGASTTHGPGDRDEAIKQVLEKPGRLAELAKMLPQPVTPDFLAALICYEMIKIPYPKYHYGMAEKLFGPGIKLGAELKWVYNDWRFNEDRNFLRRNNYKTPLFNATYVGVEDFKGCHRSGWQYVLENLMTYHSEDAPLIFDNYVDRTFHWAEDIYSYTGILPFSRPWCGFIHHTFNTNYSPYNVPNLFKKETFLKSLPHCKALFTLSKDLAVKLEVLLQHHGFPDLKVISFVHPTEIPDSQFDFYRYLQNKDRKIIQIGAWLRDTYAIFQLEPYMPAQVTGPELTNAPPYLTRMRLPVRKAALRGKNMSNYFRPSSFSLTIESDTTHFLLKDLSLEESRQILPQNNKYLNGLVQSLLDKEASVEILPTRSNAEYDQLLTENIVFLRLVDASAVNTVIECIVRATPLLVNRHPAVVEMLGTTYPFYYDSLLEAGLKCTDYNLIQETHLYLKDPVLRERFNINSFLEDIETRFKSL